MVPPSAAAPEPHVLLFPYPAQGHVTPMLKLAELLSLAGGGLRVTFLNTEDIHRRLLRHNPTLHRLSGNPFFRFRTIPDGLPEDHPRPFLHFLDLLESIKTHSRAPLRELLSPEAGSDDADGWPPVTCVVADPMVTLTVEVAEEVGVPVIIFRSSGASVVWTYHCIPELIRRGELPFPVSRVPRPNKSSGQKCLLSEIVSSAPGSVQILLSVDNLLGAGIGEMDSFIENLSKKSARMDRKRKATTSRGETSAASGRARVEEPGDEQPVPMQVVAPEVEMTRPDPAAPTSTPTANPVPMTTPRPSTKGAQLSARSRECIGWQRPTGDQRLTTAHWDALEAIAESTFVNTLYHPCPLSLAEIWLMFSSIQQRQTLRGRTWFQSLQNRSGFLYPKWKQYYLRICRLAPACMRKQSVFDNVLCVCLTICGKAVEMVCRLNATSMEKDDIIKTIKDDLLQKETSYNHELERLRNRVTFLEEAAAEHSRTELKYKQLLATTRQTLEVSRRDVASRDADIKKLKNYLERRVPEIREESYIDCLEVLLRKILLEYLDADLEYFVDDESPEGVALDLKWLEVDFCTEGSSAASIAEGQRTPAPSAAEAAVEPHARDA